MSLKHMKQSNKEIWIDLKCKLGMKISFFNQ